MSKSVFIRVAFLFALIAVSGCSSIKNLLKYPLPPSLEYRDEFRKPLTDDLDLISLELAVEQSLKYLKRKNPDKKISLGYHKVTVKKLMESHKRLLEIFKETEDPGERSKKVLRDFDVYRGTAGYTDKNVLVTGYFQPVLRGSRTAGGLYKWPLYGKPDDMVTINLGKFDKKLKGKRIVGRIKGSSFVPYHDRKDIDRNGALNNKGAEIIWVDSPIDIFFLQIQGSGIVRLENGEELFANYSAANGRSYKSIGALLIREGEISRKEMSLQAIERWLIKNPQEMERIFDYNPSYVFFRLMDDGPFGSTGAKLVPGRSAAFDPSRFPKGGLAHIAMQIPVVVDGKEVGKRKIARFVFSHDQGGAIKGSARMDLFIGKGKEARKVAGHMKHKGELLFLVLKDKAG